MDFDGFKREVLQQSQKLLDIFGGEAAAVKARIEQFLDVSKDDFTEAVNLVNRGEMSADSFRLFLKGKKDVVEFMILGATARTKDSLGNFFVDFCKIVCGIVDGFVPIDMQEICALLCGLIPH
jgi:hypothetical protein